MRKALSMILALTMGTMLLSACGGTTATPAASAPAAPAASEATTVSQTEAAPAADLTQGNKYTIRVAHAFSDQHAFHTATEQEFKKVIEEETGGRITVELYPSAQLGGERQALEGVGLETIEMTIVASPNVANIDKNYSVFDFPFLFPSEEEGNAALVGEIGEALKASIENYGYKNLGMGGMGMRQITNSKRPITKPDDMNGLKLRCMENPIHVAAFTAMGANPTPMALTEVFTGLQQKTIDGQENPLITIYDNKFNEVQDYLTLTDHLYVAGIYMCNLDWFNALSPEDQELISRCAANAANQLTLTSKANNDKALEAIKAGGTEVNELTPEQKQVFVDALQPVYEQFRDTVDADIMDKAFAMGK